MPFSETLLPEFDEEMKNTRRLLERVPDGKFEYQPHTKSMTLGRLASHIAELPSWTGFTLDLEVLELGPDHKFDLAATQADLLASFDKGVSSARAKIAAASDADWAKTWTFKWEGQTVMSMPRSVGPLLSS